MKAATLRLALLLAVLGAVSALTAVREDLGRSITLAGAALLLCGLFAGKLARQLGLPALTGYLLIGILVGPYVLRFVPGEGVAGLDLVKGLAVSLIALIAGAELELRRLRRSGARVLARCLALGGLVFVASIGMLVALRPWLPFFAEMSWGQTLALSAVIASMIVSFSPTVTIAIVQETGARGPFTEFLMTFVIIGDLVVLLAFALSVGVARSMFGGGFDAAALFGGVIWELFGSLVFGAGLGLALLVYLKKVNREVPLFIAALCFISAEAGVQMHLSPLILSLAAGAVVANMEPREAHRLVAETSKVTLPVFALFFAAAGAGLRLDVLPLIGPVALVLVIGRALALYLGSRGLVPRDEPMLRRYLWMGLISQAGVTFGLASLVSRAFPEFGGAIEFLVVAMVTVEQLIGPILVRHALEKAGEVDSSASRVSPAAH